MFLENIFQNRKSIIKQIFSTKREMHRAIDKYFPLRRIK